MKILENSRSVFQFVFQWFSQWFFKRSLLAGLFLPLSAFADGDDGDKVETVLHNLLGFVSGTWGSVICTLAIVGVGFACFVTGSIPISRAISVVIGAACVMGAPRLLDLITGTG